MSTKSAVIRVGMSVILVTGLRVPALPGHPAAGAPLLPVANASCSVTGVQLRYAQFVTLDAIEGLWTSAWTDYSKCRVVVNIYRHKAGAVITKLKAAGGLLPIKSGYPMPASTPGKVVVELVAAGPDCNSLVPEPCGWFMEQIILSPDMNGDGFGEVLTVDQDGVLHRHGFQAGNKLSRWTLIGPGWGNYEVFAPGDWDGDGLADIIAVDREGRLWLYSGNGNNGTHMYDDRPFGPEKQVEKGRQIGQGWRDYRVIPAGDLTGDGMADLLAIKISTGDLYLYAGDGQGGFQYPYPKVGNGWKGFDLYAAGDVNKDGKADILSVDSGGDLYLYSGNGNGTFAKRVKVGNGWAGYTLAAGADLDGDGIADIVSRDTRGNLFFYAGTGGGQFAKKVKIAEGW